MTVRRLNGVISGSAGIEGDLLDAIGGGICKTHGKYYGSGKYHLRTCPFCDIEEHFRREASKAASEQAKSL